MKARMMTALVVSALGIGGASAQAMLTATDAAIANEGAIGDRWMLAEGATLATPAYPPQMAARGDDVCLALGYQINPDGSTSDFAVLKQWNSTGGDEQPAPGYWQAFAEAGADALSQWRFQPRPGKASLQPTYTVATLAFTGANGEGGNIRSHCQVDDLAGLLQEQKSRAFMRGSLDRHDRDRAENAARQRLTTTLRPMGKR